MDDQHKDIYGTESFPGVDGKDVWTFLMDPTPYTKNYSAIHSALVLSKEVIVAGEYKLIVAQNVGVVDRRADWGCYLVRTHNTDPLCAPTAFRPDGNP